MKHTFEDKLILSCIKINPNATELEQINSLIPHVQDWEYLIKIVIDRGIGPLLFKKLPLLTNSSQIPESVKTKLQQVYYKTFSRSVVLYEHFRQVAEAFAVQNIPVIVLKGIYLSEWLYQDIGLRQFSDIDLLIRPQDGKRCLKILESLGFSPIKTINLSDFVIIQSDFVHYTPMYLNDISVEIHIKLHKDNEKFHLPIDALWKNSLPVTINKVHVNALEFNDLLTHLCIHLNKHFREGHVQFTCFNDITNLLDRHVNTIDWNKLIETCKLYNCENIIFEYIVLVNKYMNAPIPDYIIQKYSSLLTIEDENVFYEYLSGYDYTKPFSAVPQHVGNLKKLSKLSDKFRYVWDILFPSKDFIITKYKIKHPKFVYIYYPYRWWVGVKGFLRVISGK